MTGNDLINASQRKGDSMTSRKLLNAEIQRLLLPDLRRVRGLIDEAVGYVRGYLDGYANADDRVSVADPKTAEFPWAYGIAALRYEAGTALVLPSIQDAWRSWREHGEIRDYSGNRLDGPEE